MQQTAGDTFRKFIFAVLSTIIGGLIVYAYQDDFRAFIGKQDNTENELKYATMEKELREAKAEAEREKAKRIEAEKRKETPVDYTATPAGQFPKEDKGLASKEGMAWMTLGSPARAWLDPNKSQIRTVGGHSRWVLVADTSRWATCGHPPGGEPWREMTQQGMRSMPAGEYLIYPWGGRASPDSVYWSLAR